MNNKIHIDFMKMAIKQAHLAAYQGEVPIGAVLIDATGNIFMAHNQVIDLKDTSAHAEILAIRAAGRYVENYRLVDTVLYVTIEPCVMCMGAVMHARIKRLIFGASDPKWGGAGSLYDFAGDHRFNHKIEVIGGVCQAECSQIMKSFFKIRR